MLEETKTPSPDGHQRGSGVSRRAILKGLPALSTLGALRAFGGTEKSQPHVAVVGAGAFGGWTALHLNRMGARVTLLDAWGAGNSRSSSGGETRVTRCIYGKDRLYVQWVTRSLEFWRDLQEKSGSQIYHKTGLLWMFVSDDTYAKESLPLAEEFGLRIDQLDIPAASKRFTQVNFDGVKSVYFEHEAGYLMARQACQRVCQQFQNEGGTYLQAAVSPRSVSTDQMRHLELEDGSRLQADQFVFACGPWLGKLFPSLLGSKIFPSRQEVYYFGAPRGNTSFFPEHFPVWVDFDTPTYYGIPNVSNRGVKIADDTRGEAFDPSRGSRVPSEEGIAKARAFLGRRFPELRSAPLLEARVCQYENSPDGHLVIDHHPEFSNLWIAGGGSGHGFKLGPAVGEHVARCVLGLANPEPSLSLARLPRLKSRSTQYD